MAVFGAERSIRSAEGKTETKGEEEEEETEEEKNMCYNIIKRKKEKNTKSDPYIPEALPVLRVWDDACGRWLLCVVVVVVKYSLTGLSDAITSSSVILERRQTRPSCC